MSFPIIETERLWLQLLLPLKQGDQIVWKPADGQELVTHHQLCFVSWDEAYHFEAGFYQYNEFDIGHWAIIRKQDGLLLGWCGLKTNKESYTADLGFRLAPAHWRHGYTAEAASGCLSFAFSNTSINCIYAKMKTSNAGVSKVLSLLGMTKHNSTTAAGNAPDATQVFSVKKEEWLSLQ